MQTSLSEPLPTTALFHLSDANIKACVDELLRGFEPPPDYTVWEYADLNRVLPATSSAEKGPWRTSRIPFAREIMHELSPASKKKFIVFKKGTQVASTEILINTAFFYADVDPRPQLIIQPTIQLATRFEKQRLQPSIEACESLKGVFADKKSRDGGNTILQKDYPNGTLIIGGANSAASLCSMPIACLLLDEVDRYPLDVDGEGDPVELAIKRTTNFPNRKVYIGSSATDEETSRVEKWFLISDQRYYYVPCPHCGEKQIIKWENIKYKGTDANKLWDIHLECVHCNGEIPEHYKTWMLDNGEWIAQNPDSDIAGFHLSALYSPLGWFSWKDAIQTYLRSLGDPVKYKSFINTVLGEVYKSGVSSVDPHYIQKRVEDYPAHVPEGVLVLTAGIDNQLDRLECSVYGYGARGEEWLVDYIVFRGDPAQDHVWNMLDDYLWTEFTHENGSRMTIAGSCIDAMGANTDKVYEFCRSRAWRRIFPIYGKGGSGKQIVHKAVKSKRAGCYVYMLGVDGAKEQFYMKLKNATPGPGFVHFPTSLPMLTDNERKLTPEFFEGLTAERVITKKVSGMPVRVWDLPPGKRNEPLDTAVYSVAALNILNLNLTRMAESQKAYSPKYIKQTNLPRRGPRVISRGIS